MDQTLCLAGAEVHTTTCDQLQMVCLAGAEVTETMARDELQIDQTLCLAGSEAIVTMTCANRPAMLELR